MNTENLVPKPAPESLAEADRKEVLAATSGDLSALMAHEEGVSLLCQKLAVSLPEKNPKEIREEVEGALERLGISQISIQDAEALSSIVSTEMSAIRAQSTVEQEEKSKLGIHARLLNLREEGIGLQATLKALRVEFADGIDKEVDETLAQFEALFSPEIFPDEKELAAVESLFLSQGVSDYSPQAFASFVYTIYEQPDETISEETKQRIEKKFQLPRQRILTGGQLANATFAKSEDGNFLHDSPENALVMDNGMTSYVNPQGEAVISMAQPHDEPEIIFVRSMRDWLSEEGAKGVNYGTIRRTIQREWAGMTGLFGGTKGENDSLATNRTEATERANRFLRLLIGSREPNHLLQLEDMIQFRKALQCLVNPLNHDEDQNWNDLRALGVIRGETFDWNRLKTIGVILRENRYFASQALKDRTAPFRLLKEKLRTSDQNAQTQNESA